jgi:hypothetical protein
MKPHLIGATSSRSSVENSHLVFNGESVRYTLGDNLLSTLLEQGVEISFGCRAGVCRSCEVFNEVTQETLLCCQTQICQSLTLSSYIPSPVVPMTVNRIERLSNYVIQLHVFGAIDHVFGLPIDLHLPGQKKIRTYAESDASEPLVIAINPLSIPIDQSCLASIKEGETIKVNVANSANVRAISRFQKLTIDRFPLALILVNQSQVSLNTWQHYFTKESIKDVSHLIINGGAEDELFAVKKRLSLASEKLGFSRDQWVIQGSQLNQNIWDQIINDFQLNPNKVTFFP